MDEIHAEPEEAFQPNLHAQNLIEVREMPLSAQLTRFGIHNFTDPGFIPTEIIVALFRDARADNNELLEREYALKLNERIVHLAWHKLYKLAQKGIVKDLNTGAEDFAMDVFCTLLQELDKQNNGYVLQRFGQFMHRRFIDYSRHLNTDKRKMELNFSEAAPRNDDGEQVDPEEYFSELADDNKDICEEITHRETLLQYKSILTENEFRVYYYHYELGLPIESKKEASPSISKTMGKSERTIQTYKKNALRKLKEILQ